MKFKLNSGVAIVATRIVPLPRNSICNNSVNVPRVTIKTGLLTPDGHEQLSFAELRGNLRLRPSGLILAD